MIDGTASSPLPFGTIAITVVLKPCRVKTPDYLKRKHPPQKKRKHPFVMYDNCDHKSVYNVLTVI